MSTRAAHSVLDSAAALLSACLLAIHGCSSDGGTRTGEPDSATPSSATDANVTGDAARPDAGPGPSGTDAGGLDGGDGSSDAAVGSDSGPEAGSADSGGDDPDADGSGADACITLSEACFNGEDDDCDGLIDCEDGDCTEGAECVDLVPDALPGVPADGADPCAEGHADAGRLMQGLTASSVCAGCTYGDPISAPCTSNLASLTACGVANAATMIFSDQCRVLGFNPADARLAVFDQTVLCSGSGTPMPEPVHWTEEITFCADQRLGAGCGSDRVCMPRASGLRCMLLNGDAACPTGYPVASSWYTGASDDRACGASCPPGTPTGGTCEGDVRLYESSNCTGDYVELSVGTTCNTGGSFASARIFVDSQTLPTCEPPVLGATGTAMPTGPRTLCCTD